MPMRVEINLGLSFVSCFIDHFWIRRYERPCELKSITFGVNVFMALDDLQQIAEAD